MGGKDGDNGIVVITGAASGMGRAAAKAMAAAGRPLLLCDLQEDRLAAVQGMLGSAGIETLAGDISEEGFSAQLLSALESRKIAAFVHSAGLSATMAAPARLLQVNLAATMRLVDAILPSMASGGAVVLVASLAGHLLGRGLDDQIVRIASPDQVPELLPYATDPETAYSISKRGVQLLAEQKAHEFGALNARIVSLSPGIIDTPMGQAEMASHPFINRIIDTSALKRLAQADEIARVIAFLCSSDASFITGTDILVHGGARTRLSDI